MKVEFVKRGRKLDKAADYVSSKNGERIFNPQEYIQSQDWKNIIQKLVDLIESGEDRMGGMEALALVKQFLPEYTSNIRLKDEYLTNVKPGLLQARSWETPSWWMKMLITYKWLYPNETRDLEAYVINPQIYNEPRYPEDRALSYMADPTHQTISTEQAKEIEAALDDTSTTFVGGTLGEFALLIVSPNYREKIRREIDTDTHEIMAQIRILDTDKGNVPILIYKVIRQLLAHAEKVEYTDRKFVVTPRKKSLKTQDLPTRMAV